MIAAPKFPRVALQLLLNSLTSFLHHPPISDDDVVPMDVDPTSDQRKDEARDRISSVDRGSRLAFPTEAAAPAGPPLGSNDRPSVERGGLQIAGESALCARRLVEVLRCQRQVRGGAAKGDGGWQRGLWEETKMGMAQPSLCPSLWDRIDSSATNQGP